MQKQRPSGRSGGARGFGASSSRLCFCTGWPRWWAISPALLGLISTVVVCWAYETSAGKKRHQAATAPLFALGANLTLAIANLMLLRLARGSAVRPMGLVMANVVVPVVSGVIGTVLSIRGAIVDRGLWRLLSAPGLLLSLMAFETGQLCFAAAVHLRGLVLKP